MDQTVAHILGQKSKKAQSLSENLLGLIELNA